MTHTEARTEALTAARAFGGCAQEDQAELIRELEAEGLVEICCNDPLDGSIGYVLTPAGKAEAWRVVTA